MSRPSSADLQSASENLPLGWSHVALGELGLGRTEGIEPAEEPDTLFELWSVPSFPSGQPEQVLGSTIGSNKQRVAEGDVLLCKINPRINRVWRVGPPSGLPQIASTEWIVFRSSAFDPAFLMWRFRENKFRAALCANMTGVGGSLTRARPKDVAQIEIALPPLPEQRRIVARLEALEARSRRAREKLAEVPTQLAQARQSLLAAAFRGDLTADWRKTHPPKLNAENLAGHIQAERRVEWEKYFARRQIKSGNPPTNDKWKSRYKPAVEIPHSEKPTLPKGWACLSAEGCAWEVTVGYVGPMKSEYVPRGVPFLRSQNVRVGYYDSRELKFINKSFHEKLRKSTLGPGDVAIVRTGAPGTACVIPKTLGEANCSDLVIARPLSSINPHFLSWYINSPIARDRVFRLKVGVAQQHFNVGAMSELAVPVPPLAEQHEIVRRLTTALAQQDAAATARAAAVADLDRLNQSLLTRAFQGKLVSQSKDDEPITILLDRLAKIALEQPIKTKLIRPRTGAKLTLNKSRFLMLKSRRDPDVKEQRYLAKILHDVKEPLNAEKLFKRSQLPLVDFYKQLGWEVANGYVKGDREKLEATA
jgi:type I restriction enzyme S subunit